MKKCPYCAESIQDEAIYCRFCGKNIGVATAQTPPPIYYPGQPTQPPVHPAPADGNKFGLSLTAILISAYALYSGLFDLNGVTSGDYGYIYTSEIGLLLILSVISLGLAIPAVVQKHRLGAGALTMSILSLVVTFACASYAG